MRYLSILICGVLLGITFIWLKNHNDIPTSLFIADIVCLIISTVINSKGKNQTNI